MITAEKFRQAFKAEWDSRINTDSEVRKIAKKYPYKRKWTSFMLAKGGLLHKAMDRLYTPGDKLEYCGYYTIDAMYASGDLYRKGCSYPAKLHALIEHENGNNIEEEMWKLIFWRSPLKVIIFYDWDEHEKKKPAKIDWLCHKLEKLKNMLAEADNFQTEAAAEYLFIIGNRKEKGGIPMWRYASCTDTKPKYLQ